MKHMHLHNEYAPVGMRDGVGGSYAREWTPSRGCTYHGWQLLCRTIVECLELVCCLAVSGKNNIASDIKPVAYPGSRCGGGARNGEDKQLNWRPWNGRDGDFGGVRHEKWEVGPCNPL